MTFIKGQKAWNKNKKLSKEHIKNLSESHKGYNPSKENLMKRSNSLKGRFLKEESSQWKGGSTNYWHKKAWELFGQDKCEVCGMSNEEHINKWGHKLELHNNLESKDYTILKKDIWTTICKSCHSKIEYKNRKIDNGNGRLLIS